MGTHTPISRNRLLALLPAADYQRLAPDIKPMLLIQGQTLYQRGQRIQSVYFPIDAVVSLESAPPKYARSEAGLVGCEGMVGLSALMGGRQSLTGSTVVQLGGDAMQLDTAALKAEFQQGLALQQLLLRYTEVRLMQVSQIFACQSHHTLKQRLVRWLLTLQDRVQTEQLPITQKFMATLLGVRLGSVSKAANLLQDAHLIRYQREQVTILDRAGLKQAACECYRLINTELDRLLV